MKRILKIVLTALVVVGVTLLTIYFFSEGKKREVKNTVVMYNDILRKSHLEMNASLVSKLASERQLKKIDSYIAFNFKNGRIIDGELKDLKFMELKIKDDSATVITMEGWRWRYLDPAAKKPISEDYDDLYGNTYYLKKVEGHWVVDDLTSEVIDAAPEK